MKKTLTLILCAILFATALLPAAAADSIPTLVITEVFRNPSGADTYESFEIMNTSSKTVDLYEYMVYYYGGSTSATVESNSAATQDKVTTYCYLAAQPGQVTLEPGEIAMVWCVYSDAYKREDEKYGPYVKDLGNGAVEYNFDAYRNFMLTDSGETLDPTVKVVVNDKSDGKYYETGKNASWGFNLGNSGAIRMWLCERGATIEQALCIVDVTKTDAGVSSSFEPQSGNALMLATASDNFTPGLLDKAQTILSAHLVSLNAPETTVAPQETTTPAVTTTPVITAAPVTTTAPAATPATADQLLPMTAIVLMALLTCALLGRKNRA